MPISYPVIVVIAVILFLVLALYKEWFRPVIVFFIAIVALFAFNVISAKDVLAGFANEQIVVIFLLVILSDAFRKTAVLEVAFKSLFKSSLSYRGFLARMMGTLSPVSGFVNNTPLVAIMIPHVYDWAKKKGISPSKVLIPLSYATILGGTITLIGTSTNLVVNGLAVSAGLKSLHFFDFAVVGIPLTIIGVLFIVLLSDKLLPSRKDALSDFTEKTREYMMEAMVAEGSDYIGKTIEQAGLRNLRGLFLVEIVRREKHIAPVGPGEVLVQNDILIFAGATETIIDLLKSPKELTLPQHSSMPQQEEMAIIEVVVSANSSLIGKIVKETSFRGKYDAAIVAINRNGERLSGKIGEIELRSGDLLLLLTGKDFATRVDENQDMHVISKLREIHHMDKPKAIALVGGSLVAFITAALGYISLFKALLILMCLIALMKMIRLSELRKSLDVDMFIILALSLAIGRAIEKSGAGTLIADYLVKAVYPVGHVIAVLFALYLFTNVLAMFVTNKAAVAITFPIAIAAASQMGINDFTPFILLIAFAGSAEFMTPYGYQTNLMVYGPGNYKYKDYLKAGWVLSLLCMLLTVFVLGYVYHLY